LRVGLLEEVCGKLRFQRIFPEAASIRVIIKYAVLQRKQRNQLIYFRSQLILQGRKFEKKSKKRKVKATPAMSHFKDDVLTLTKYSKSHLDHCHPFKCGSPVASGSSSSSKYTSTASSSSFGRSTSSSSFRQDSSNSSGRSAKSSSETWGVMFKDRQHFIDMHNF